MGQLADPVEGGNDAFAVVSDRHRPVVLARKFAHRAAFVADVQREEAHPSTVALIGALQRVLLGDAVASPRKPKREHQGALEEVADTDRTGDVNATGGRAALAGPGQGTWEVSQSSWATFACPSKALAAAGTANLGSGHRAGSASTPSVAGWLAPIVWMKATTISAKNSAPTTIE